MNTATVLERPVLVLNKHWVPIQTKTTKEAIGLVAKGNARIIEPDTYLTHDLLSWNDVSKAKKVVGDLMIRSTRLELVPPEVIQLTGYQGIGQRTVVFSRRNLFKRDRYTCQYCGVQPGTEELTIDHVIPRCQGGKSVWENAVLACIDCNSRKADRTPEQAGMKLRKIPTKPSWKTLVQVHPSERRLSWDAFLGEAYWEVELKP
jgi:5-methylcytosine-specific restriction endonuclease McrA